MKGMVEKANLGKIKRAGIIPKFGLDLDRICKDQQAYASNPKVKSKQQ
jgi:hypothetical protein